MARHVFPFPIVQRPVLRSSRDVEFDWRGYHDETQLDPVLRALARTAELDGFGGENCRRLSHTQKSEK